MTLNTRNKFLLSLIVVSVSFLLLFLIVALINFLKGNFSLIPDFQRILPIDSNNFLLKNSPIASILSIIVLLIYIPISSYFLYTSFEKTKSPETIYLMGFFVGCLLQSIRILIVLLKIWDTSSALLMMIGKIEIVGKLLAPICLVFTALFSEQDQIQQADKNISLALACTIICAYILPINITKIFSNFTLSCGFDSFINLFIFLCSGITTVGFFVASKQRYITFWKSPTPYFILMFFGYMTISISDCLLTLFIGTLFLVIGTYYILSKLHKYYLWK